MPQHSPLHQYADELLNRKDAGATYTDLVTWLGERGVRTTSNNLRQFLRRQRQRAGPPPPPSPPPLPSAPVIKVEAVAETVARLQRTPQAEGLQPQLAELHALAVDRLSSGEATVADAKVIEATLKVLLAARLAE